MSKFNLIFLVVLIYLITRIESRPRTQKITIHGHEWIVPNEEGWREVLEEAEPYRHKHLSNCANSRACRQAAERLREIFLKHPVSAKYYDDSPDNDFRSNNMDSIFKWG